MMKALVSGKLLIFKSEDLAVLVKSSVNAWERKGYVTSRYRAIKDRHGVRDLTRLKFKSKRLSHATNSYATIELTPRAF